MSRRVSRLRTETPDRKPVLIVGALVIGVVVGMIAVPRMVPSSDARTDQYVLLASTLYQQGANPRTLHDRMVSVGFSQPASAVLSLAQRYAGSRDRKQQAQAESLDAFGKVLLNPEAAATPTPRPAEPPPAAPAAQPAASATPNAALPGAPTARSTVTGLVPVTTPVPATPPTAGTPAAAGAAAAPGAAAPPTSTPAAVQRGRVRPADGGSARLRKEPNQNGGTLSLIPNAAQVDILETVHGQAIEGETRWLRVRYGNLVGYLWSKLVVVGD